MREVSYNLHEQITEGFSAERKVGEGGYAQVYYGSGYLANTDSSQELPAHLVVKVDKFAYEGAGQGYECALAIECLHGYDKYGDKTQLNYTSTRT